MLLLQKNLMSEEKLALYLIRAIFPHEEHEELDIPFVRKIKDERWFCYQAQFNFEIKETEKHYQILCDWHELAERVPCLEQAFCVLHRIFDYSDQAHRGF